MGPEAIWTCDLRNKEEGAGKEDEEEEEEEVVEDEEELRYRHILENVTPYFDI